MFLLLSFCFQGIVARGFTFSLCEPMQDGGGIWQESGCLLVTLLRGNRRRAGIFSEGRFILNSDVPRCLLVHYQRIRRSRAGRLGVRVWDEDKILFGHEDEHKCADDDERTNQVSRNKRVQRQSQSQRNNMYVPKDPIERCATATTMYK